MHRGVVVAMAVFGLALAGMAGGCGSDEETLSKAEFIKQADAICRQAEEKKNGDLEQAFTKKKYQGSQKSVQEELVSDVALPPIATMADELGDLGAPDEQAEAVTDSYSEAVEKIEADPSLAISTENPFQKADGMAKKYGMKECSNI